MTIKFYNTNSDVKSVTKNLTYIDGTTVARNTADVDVINPVLIMKYKESYLTNSNYMYIEEFKRYYFITVTVMTGGNVMIKGTVDVLMTADNAIRNNGACVVKRNEYNSSAYVGDMQTTLSTKPSTVVKKFPYTFKNFSIFLLAAGGTN